MVAIASKPFAMLAALQSEEFQFSTSTSLFLLHCFFRKYFFSFYVLRLLVGFFIWFTCFILNTLKTRSIILEVTHSSLSSSFFLYSCFYFLMNFISERLSPFPPCEPSPVLCATLAHQIAVLSCFFSCFAFYPLTSSPRFFRRTERSDQR